MNFDKRYRKYNFLANECNHNQMMNDLTIQNHFFLCYIIRNQSMKCALLHPCVDIGLMSEGGRKHSLQADTCDQDIHIQQNLSITTT